MYYMHIRWLYNDPGCWISIVKLPEIEQYRYCKMRLLSMTLLVTILATYWSLFWPPTSAVIVQYSVHSTYNTGNMWTRVCFAYAKVWEYWFACAYVRRTYAHANFARRAHMGMHVNAYMYACVCLFVGIWERVWEYWHDCVSVCMRACVYACVCRYMRMVVSRYTRWYNVLPNTIINVVFVLFVYR